VQLLWVDSEAFAVGTHQRELASPWLPKNGQMPRTETITGYTEWVISSMPTIRISDIRSNIMLLNHRQIDHDVQKTMHC
jgi:hypothetical protein